MYLFGNESTSTDTSVIVLCTVLEEYNRGNCANCGRTKLGRCVLGWKELPSPEGIRASSAELLKGVKLVYEKETEKKRKPFVSRVPLGRFRAPTMSLDCFNGVVAEILSCN